MMREKLKFALLGGDARQLFVARRLLESGASLRLWGQGEVEDSLLREFSCVDWRGALKDADVLLLPLPVSTDGVRLNCPLREKDESPRLSLLLDSFGGRLILGGKLPMILREQAEERGILCVDYFESELLQLKNALPTAEGAIFVAMGELPVTLDGCETAVVGYGRIGSLLAEKLAALGAKVTVFARRREVLENAKLRHHEGILLNPKDGSCALQNLSKDLRVIFNTVPTRLFTDEVLNTFPKDCLFIDLASAPGGIDFSAAEARGIRAVLATALPGKYSPETAGLLLAQALEAILEELESNGEIP